MNSLSQPKPLQPLADLIVTHEQWLMNRIQKYAIKHKYAEYTSTLPKAWQVSICKLSEPLIRAIAEYQEIPELEPYHNHQQDTITEVGIIQARHYSRLGINFSLLLGLMKDYRQSYVDLLELGNFQSEEKNTYTLFINRFFDRLELGFCSEWTELTAEKKILELQQKNIDLSTDLAETEEKLNAIVNFNVNGLIITDRQGKILFINPAGEQILNSKAQEILGEDFGIPLNFQTSTEIAIPHKKGQLLIAEMNVIPIFWKKKRAYLVSLVDVTKRKEIEEKLKFLYQASEQSPASIIITNSEGKIVYVNSKFEKTTGYLREEVIGENPRILKSGHYDTQTYTKLWETISSGEEWHGEFHNRKKNGELFWEAASISPIKDENDIVTYYVAVKEDITEKKAQQELLSYQANYDALTDLPNRLFGMRRLKQEIANANRNKYSVALIFLDLDHFKEINDTLGHQYGDELLVIASERFRSCLRESDTVARLGGDEFLIIISSLSSPLQGEIITSKLLHAMGQPFMLAGEERFISASIGVTFYPQDSDNIPTLMQNADLAMYAAKKKGRNNCQFFNEQMNVVAQKKMLEESYLRQALKNDELSLVYQPIINLQTKQVIGVESLMRWHSDYLGDVSPRDFIAIAEETGLIMELGKWLLETVCQQILMWQKKGIDIYVSINFSPRQFRDLNLQKEILATVNKYGVELGYIKLEITEQLLLEEIIIVQDLLFDLDSAEFDLFLDDFGTGYSALSYLRKYPFQAIKIDRSFVMDIEKSSEVKALIKTMIAMAHHLDLLVIAEGIETEEQLFFLESEHCFAGQGYLLSHPLTADNLGDFVKKDSQ